jgi:hypothetical protein
MITTFGRIRNAWNGIRRMSRKALHRRLIPEDGRVQAESGGTRLAALKGV